MKTQNEVVKTRCFRCGRVVRIEDGRIRSHNVNRTGSTPCEASGAEVSL